MHAYIFSLHLADNSFPSEQSALHWKTRSWSEGRCTGRRSIKFWVRFVGCSVNTDILEVSPSCVVLLELNSKETLSILNDNAKLKDFALRIVVVAAQKIRKSADVVEISLTQQLISLTFTWWSDSTTSHQLKQPSVSVNKHLVKFKLRICIIKNANKSRVWMFCNGWHLCGKFCPPTLKVIKSWPLIFTQYLIVEFYQPAPS